MFIHYLIAPLLLAVASAHVQAAPANDAALRAKLKLQNVERDVSRAVISFVAPGSLFPGDEGKDARGVKPETVEKYQPLPAYDKPNGARIGDVRDTNGTCGVDGSAACAGDAVWYLQRADGAAYALAVYQYAYSTDSLPSYRDSVKEGTGKLWSEIEYAKGKFWVLTDTSSVVSYASRARYTVGFDTWCSAPGACKPVDKRMADELMGMQDGTYEPDGCFSAAYEIESVVALDGKSYYKVKLNGVADGSKKPKLPKAGYIPVRNSDGSHTGKFDPMGC